MTMTPVKASGEALMAPPDPPVTSNSSPAGSSQAPDMESIRVFEKDKPGILKRLVKPLVYLVIAAVLAVAGTMVYHHLTTFQETDDAYVTAHVMPISSRIEDNVERVLIDDNEHVKKGQVIVELDPRDFQRKVDEARATIERLKKEAVVTRGNTALAAMNSQATKLNAQSDIAGSSSTIEKAQMAIHECDYAIAEQEQILIQKDAELARAGVDFERYKTLETQGAVTTSSRDSARRDLDVAKAAVVATKRAIDQKKAQLGEARHQLSIAKAQLVHSQGTERTARSSEIQEKVSTLQQDVSVAAIREAEAKLNSALLQLSYCRIVAPVDGRVGRKTVEIGQRVQPGGRLLTLTGDDIWVVANFKENQLERMKIGQPVDLKIDALPHESFSGTIDSFSPGSGAQFTLIPPDNATGNFTKIVQRVPVKIRFKDSIDKVRDKLVPGLSATVAVNVSK